MIETFSEFMEYFPETVLSRFQDEKFSSHEWNHIEIPLNNQEQEFFEDLISD